MGTLNEVLPVIIYILLAILIIGLIVLVIKLIVVSENANKLIVNVEDKVNKFNSLFKAVDSTCQALSFASGKLSSFIVSTITKIIGKDDKNE